MSRTVNERIIFGMLAQLSHGSLTLTQPSGQQQILGDPSSGSGLQADLHIHDPAVYSEILRGGDIAFAQAFMDGKVTTSDLPSLLKLFVKNRAKIDAALHGSWWGVLLDRWLHLFRRNTKRQARKNIEAHYDLGNDFYKLWLDPSMTYSSAIFDAPHNNVETDAALLEAAQIAKYERVLAQLGNASNILEIGCGWGGFAQVAASNERHITGLTLSTEQLVCAQDRLGKLGCTESVHFKLQDYRDEGQDEATSKPRQYDGIASIEMFEAVGEAYWPSYFDCIARNLKDDGIACVQSIVIKNELFERYRAGTDFIQRYIFPGGMLPSPAVFEAAAAKAGLVVTDRFSFGKDYARTLAVWRRNFLTVLPQVRALGYSERFIKMWEFYLAYCEAGFDSGDTDVMQFTLALV
jgi:cyclopropane-fatty-acyl-phospholipid synthase